MFKEAPHGNQCHQCAFTLFSSCPVDNLMNSVAVKHVVSVLCDAFPYVAPFFISENEALHVTQVKRNFILVIH